MAYIGAKSEIREQYFAAKSDSCISIIYLSSYPFFRSYFLSLATSHISLFCRYCVLMKIFMSVSNKVRLSTNIKSCHSTSVLGVMWPQKKHIFHIKNSKAISHPKMYCEYFPYSLISCTLLHQMFLCHWISSGSSSSENYINVPSFFHAMLELQIRFSSLCCVDQRWKSCVDNSNERDTALLAKMVNN